MRSVRGQRGLPALRGADLRGLQGLLQEDRPEERQVRLPGRQELPRRQETTKPLPVLPVPEVFNCWDGEGGGADGRPEGAEGAAAHQAAPPDGPGLHPARSPHHGTRQGTRRLITQIRKPGLLPGRIILFSSSFKGHFTFTFNY